MANSEGLLHPFCIPEVLEDLSRSWVKEIAPDVWFLLGYYGPNFFIAPSSCNIFILRDGDLVFLLDTGTYPYYRESMRKILRKYAQEGAKTLVLMVTQGHWDHIMNNRVIQEVGYSDVRFLLPEPEVPVIDLPSHWVNDFRALGEYTGMHQRTNAMLKGFQEHAHNFEAYSNPQYEELWKAIDELPDEPKNYQLQSAMKLFYDKVIFHDFRNMAEIAEILPLESREKKMFGDVEVEGWQVGRFFVIHDASHSPGHVSLYDPENKLMLTGDATLEINPAFFDSSMDKCIELARMCRCMAEQGFINLATDSHRGPTMNERLREAGVEPLDPIQLIDMARGQDECIAFYRMFEDYYSQLKEETLAAHSMIGQATVQEIMEELSKSTNTAIRFKKAIEFPVRPSRLNNMVARILKETGATRREEGDRVLFTPYEKWKF